ncbi:MAG: tRNA (N6-threonylcarbamoyladenosine(37)-N6)-methyltransferase TrmO [Akkermansia sp.]|nr:tRNA (N6-threonylcarbamoyladenosine(37)-N6)-methyltransferase TrmO [Akkermansia sp.]
MNLQPIAYLRSPFADKFGVPRQGNLAPHVISDIVFEPAFAQAECLRGMEEFSHLWLIWGFHCNDGQAWHPTVRPPRLGGNTRVGVFATRSPFRPNPLGLSVVKLVSVESGVLRVSGADMVNGTPIYDIKPYIPYADSIPDAASGFTARPWEPLRVRVAAPLPAGTTPEWVEGMREVLAQDPRPAYQQSLERVYHIVFLPFEVSFRVEDGVAVVIDISPVRS